MGHRDEQRYRDRTAYLEQQNAAGHDISDLLATEKLTRDNARAAEIAERMRAERDDD
jgi:hypothetical protein